MTARVAPFGAIGDKFAQPFRSGLKMKPSLALLFLVTLSACESDVKKAQRLEAEKTTLCLDEQYYYDKLTAAQSATVNKPAKNQTDSLARTWMEYRAKCAVATRDYDRLMR